MIQIANASGLILAAALAIIYLARFTIVRWGQRKRLSAWGGEKSVSLFKLAPSGDIDIIANFCFHMSLILGIAAFCRPQWGEIAENVRKVGLNCVIALDLSRSMASKDVTPTRLDRAKMEIAALLERDADDKFGLVGFAGVPVTLSPLTDDAGALSMLLEVADPELCPAQGTDVGKAIEESSRLFPKDSESDKVILLISDGEDQGDKAVAEVRSAQRSGIKVFCLGVGTAGGSPVLDASSQPVTDPETGQPAMTKLDSAALQQLSTLSDGRYWRMDDTATELASQVTEEFNRLKRREYASRASAVREEHYSFFLIPAALLLAGALVIPGRKIGRPGRREAGRNQGEDRLSA